MSAESVPNIAVHQMARTLGAAGFRVVRVYPGDKRPVGLEWTKHATADVEVLDRQFSSGPLNIGVACGPQPNGVNLVVVDVDIRDDGMARWAAMVAEHPPLVTACHTTPSGGLHVFFDAPEAISNGKLGPGIDIRGVGGQVVVPPSSRVIDGVERFYGELLPRSGLHRHPVAAMSLWLVDELVRPSPLVVERSKLRHPSNDGGGVENADWLRDHWDWVAVLEGQGHVVVGQRGADVFLRHPTATADHSCVVHVDEGWMCAFSTNMPSPLRAAQVNRDGSVSWTPYDWFVATEFGGDYSAATREINRRRLPLSAAPTPVRAPAPVTAGADVVALYPPVEFYDQRPWMAACRQMAQAVGGSPSAHLLAFLARWATLIPPGYSIPAINGAPSSFDLLGVIAGTSGAGKTSPMRNAAELLPIDRKDLRLGLGIGSGEGIIEAFYAVVDEVDGDGKKRRERRKAISGVNFSVSEGLIFAELAGRGGTTHVTRLCDAWSGAALSTANANAETFRHIDVDQYRLTLVMGIQADQAHELMTDSAASQGFVGRLLFAWAEEPRVAPRPRPPLPVTSIPTPPVIGVGGVHQRTYLTYPEQVYAECQSASDQRVGTDVPVEDHHHDLLRCKVAGIVALMDGRLDVSEADWGLATTLLTHSAAVRRYLYAHRRQQDQARRHSAAEARAETELVVENVKDRQGIARMAEAIKRKVEQTEWSRNKLCKAVSSTGTRHRFDAALDLAVANGWAKVAEGHVHRP